MSVEAEADPLRADQRPPLLRRLLPAGEPMTAEEMADELRLDDALHVGGSHALIRRPLVLLNMVSTADGLITIGGRSGPIGNRTDREVFHALRGVVDAVMVGAGTARAERYGRIVPDEARRRRRRERGHGEEPIACIVSGRLSLGVDLPLLAQPGANVVIITSSPGSLPESAADVHYIRAEHDGVLDLAAALVELRERFGVRTLLCEGGPHLNRELFDAGLVDELFLSLSPKLAGGAPGDAEALRILVGTPFEQPFELDLVAALESDSQLFLRYRARASAPPSVSRETMLRSSPAR